MAGFSIGNLFRPTQQVTIAPTQQQQQQQVPPMGQNNPGADPANLPAPQNQQTPPAEPPNPLDAFKDLWKTDPNATPPQDPLAQPLFNTDPAKIREAAGKIDFLGQVPQDVMAKVQSGDQQALLQVINFVAQKSFATATELNAATHEQAYARTTERWQQALPNRVKELQVNSIQSDNPVLSHPAAAPMLDMTKRQLQMKHPDKTPQEIHRMAESYLTDFAKSLNPNTPATQPESSGGTDWEKWGSV